MTTSLPHNFGACYGGKKAAPLPTGGIKSSRQRHDMTSPEGQQQSCLLGCQKITPLKDLCRSDVVLTAPAADGSSSTYTLSTISPTR